MITKILVLDPNKRLGAGPSGSENDYNSLKNHEFFKGMDFAKLNEMEIPIKAELVDDSPKDKLTMNQSFSQRAEGIVYRGIMKKRNKFFWNQERYLVLLGDGKINYYKDKQLYRGTI